MKMFGDFQVEIKVEEKWNESKFQVSVHQSSFFLFFFHFKVGIRKSIKDNSSDTVLYIQYGRMDVSGYASFNYERK